MEQKLRLGCYTSSPRHLDPIRDLTSDEVEKNARFTPIYKEAANRLKLFHILGLNYDAWSKFTDSLLNAKPDSTNDMLKADQLLFNFLASAYGITEHFNVSFRQRFKKDAAKIKEYEDFLDRLCAGSWAVAFFFDFRNYVQHVGLPVGRYNKYRDRTKVEITIEQDAAELVKDYAGWKRSKLDASRGKIDLVELSFDYFLYLKRDYAKFVAKTFYPELVEIHQFYSSLATEATGGDSDTRMLFISESKEDADSLKLSFIEPPNDPMREIGILVEPQAPTQ